MYDADDWLLKKEATDFLKEVAEVLKSNKDFKVEIDIYTPYDNWDKKVREPVRLRSWKESFTGAKYPRTVKKMMELRRNVIINYLVKTLGVDPSQIMNKGDGMLHKSSGKAGDQHFKVKFLRK